MIVSRNSRYATAPTAVLREADGTTVQYLQRRFIPQSDDIDQIAQVDPARAGMRIDVLAARLLGDPEQYWRLLDANDGMNPFDFIDETAGAPLRIPHPMSGR